MMISIIVPVYNIEKYLPRCIESILGQTYTDYEVILVNDGSTDGSGQICDDYASRYTQFRVIHKENGGPSEARNTGILQAAGEYVTYIDGDDYVTEDYLSELLRLREEKNADIACGSFGYFYGDQPEKLQPKAIREDRIYNGKAACKALMLEKDFYSSSCCMLIPVRIAQENLFPPGRYHEDEMTTFRYFLAVDQVAIMDRVLYYYFQRQGSIMHRFGDPVLDELKSADYYVGYCRELDSDVQDAARIRQYSLIARTLEDYPELKDRYPRLYQEKKDFLKRNGVWMLFQKNVSWRIRRIALNAITGRK